jgi:hypothetical protein
LLERDLEVVVSLNLDPILLKVGLELSSGGSCNLQIVKLLLGSLFKVSIDSSVPLLVSLVISSVPIDVIGDVFGHDELGINLMSLYSQSVV